MRRKMIFKMGMTLVVFVGVFLYYMIKTEDRSRSLSADNKEEQYNMAAENFEDSAGSIAESRQQGVAASLEHDAVENKRIIRVVPREEEMHLSVVACGEPRVEETLTLLKSAALLSRKHLVFHIFAEDNLHQPFTDQLKFWPEEYQKKFRFNIYSITFPPDQDAKEWKKLFKPCASQRLFIPVLLRDVDSVLYVDTDNLFMRPVDDVWEHFHKFNSTQLAAVAPEHEDEQTSWYKRFARHPYYGHLGVNSGVMLMNLTRMREFDWLTRVLVYYRQYKTKITWGDQDLINIIFHFFPERLYVYPCEWNFRPDHCMYMSTCQSAERAGISVLHGNRGVLHNNKQPVFKAVYKAFKEHRLGDSLQHKLLVKMKRNMEAAKNTNCGKVANIFTKQFEFQVAEHQKHMDELWDLGQDTVRQV